MKSKWCLIFTIVILSAILINCASFFKAEKQKTLKEKAIEQIWYISTPKQNKMLKSLNTPEKINKFLTDFWKKLDPTPETVKNEMNDEYLKRYEYACKYYPHRKGLGASDRARVYILYGPPNYIDRYPMTCMYIDQFAKISSLEIWIYNRSAGHFETPNIFSKIYPHQMKFVFGDLIGNGLATQIYSNVAGEKIDTRVLVNDK